MIRMSTDERDEELLASVTKLVQSEFALSQALDKTKPILQLATPTTMSQVETILALARTYSTRTSAPPGWSSDLPVVHFATPNPLPHQLRGGNLASMQLKIARDENRAKKKRKREREVEQQERMRLKEQQQMEEEENKINVAAKDEEMKRQNNGKEMIDPKRRDILSHQREEGERMKQQTISEGLGNKTSITHKKPANDVGMSMNLSDSSSEEESDDED